MAMKEAHETKEDQGEAARAALIQMISGGRVAQAVYVAARLKIADLLADGPRTATELATLSEAHPPSLYRLLRALASLGVFAEGPDGTFSLTPRANFLRSDVPGSVRPGAVYLAGPYRWRCMGELLHSVRTGQTVPQHLYGVDEWEYLARHPEDAAVFNEAMTANTRQQIPAILEAYDFSGIDSLVDIAGGHGALLAAVLRVYPQMYGVLFDQPHVVEGAPDVLEESGVADRCRIVGGDMFGELPSGGGAYLLKLILHDWDDNHAAQILSNLRRTMSAPAKLLLIENVIQPGNGPQPAKLLDLTMLTNPGGRERTAAEWEDMLQATGFSLTGITPTSAGLGILEAAPR